MKVIAQCSFLLVLCSLIWPPCEELCHTLLLPQTKIFQPLHLHHRDGSHSPKLCAKINLCSLSRLCHSNEGTTSMKGPVHGCLSLLEKFLGSPGCGWWQRPLRALFRELVQQEKIGSSELPGLGLCVGPNHRVHQASGNDIKSTYTMIPKWFPRR